MKSSVVLELQRDALDPSMKVSDLLRKALVVARKLDVVDFEHWIDKELNGYPEGEHVPEYRMIRGLPRAWNPYHGWIPIVFGDPEVGEALSQRGTNQSIGEIEALIDSPRDGGLQMPYSHSTQSKLMQAGGLNLPASLHFASSQLKGILEIVRNVALNWALKLEKDGILGGGLSFTGEEKTAAAQAGYTVNNFLGSVDRVQIQQDSPHATQVMHAGLEKEQIAELVELIKSASKQVELHEEIRAEFDAELQTVEAQLGSPKPKDSIIRGALRSISRMLESAAAKGGGDALAQVLVKLPTIIGGS